VTHSSILRGWPRFPFCLTVRRRGPLADSCRRAVRSFSALTGLDPVQRSKVFGHVNAIIQRSARLSGEPRFWALSAAVRSSARSRPLKHGLVAVACDADRAVAEVARVKYRIGVVAARREDRGIAESSASGATAPSFPEKPQVHRHIEYLYATRYRCQATNPITHLVSPRSRYGSLASTITRA
jgi:hypothetical protein